MHTEGKLTYQEGSEAYTHEIRDSRWKLIASTPKCASGIEEANARRLVACWNQFDGIKSEFLEEMPESGVVGLIRHTKKVSEERDELVSALDALETKNRRLTDDLEAMDLDSKSIWDSMHAYKSERDELVKALRELHTHGFSANRIQCIDMLLAKYPEAPNA